MRSLRTATKSSPRSLQLEKACVLRAATKTQCSQKKEKKNGFLGLPWWSSG